MSDISRRGVMGVVAGAVAAPALVRDAVAEPDLSGQDEIETLGLNLSLSPDEIAKHGKFILDVIIPAFIPLFDAVARARWEKAFFGVMINHETGDVDFHVSSDVHMRRSLEAYLAQERLKAA